MKAILGNFAAYVVLAYIRKQSDMHEKRYHGEQAVFYKQQAILGIGDKLFLLGLKLR